MRVRSFSSVTRRMRETCIWETPICSHAGSGERASQSCARQHSEGRARRTPPRTRQHLPLSVATLDLLPDFGRSAGACPGELAKTAPARPSFPRPNNLEASRREGSGERLCLRLYDQQIVRRLMSPDGGARGCDQPSEDPMTGQLNYRVAKQKLVDLVRSAEQARIAQPARPIGSSSRPDGLISRVLATRRLLAFRAISSADCDGVAALFASLSRESRRGRSSHRSPNWGLASLPTSPISITSTTRPSPPSSSAAARSSAWAATFATPADRRSPTWPSRSPTNCRAWASAPPSPATPCSAPARTAGHVRRHRSGRPTCSTASSSARSPSPRSMSIAARSPRPLT